VTRVLVVEDEDSFSDAISYLLRKEGFEVAVCSTGPDALDTFDRTGADLVLLDLMLPGLPGSEVCRSLREKSNVPVIMLTAKDSEIDKVVGLELGADDYVTKPFSPKELLARVRRAMRRGQVPDSANPASSGAPHYVLAFDEVRIDFTSMVATRGSKALTFTAQEFKLLKYFAGSPARVISREELLNEVWGYENYPTTRTVDNHVLRLRQKLEPDPANPRYFHTMHGAGYKFVPGESSFVPEK
jgi:two-component system response regulator RegX3